MKSLSSREKQALDPYASGESPSLTEDQLLRIVEKCNNYDLNVQRNKIDLRYLQELRNCLADFNKLKEYIPENKHVDPAIVAKVSKRLEEKVLEMFELIRKNKQFVIPMDIINQLSMLQKLSKAKINPTLQGKFLSLVFREYNKFKEVANVRQYKQQAIKLLEQERLKNELQDNLAAIREEQSKRAKQKMKVSYANLKAVSDRQSRQNISPEVSQRF